MYKQFSEGWEEAEGDESTWNCTNEKGKVQNIKEIVQKDRRLNIWMIPNSFHDMVKTNKETVRQILHDEFNIASDCKNYTKKPHSGTKGQREEHFI